MKTGTNTVKFCLLGLVVVFGLFAQGCGAAKGGHVKAKNTGCNCGF